MSTFILSLSVLVSTVSILIIVLRVIPLKQNSRESGE